MSEQARRYPEKLEIVPLTRPPHAIVRVPGSKSITNRALVLASILSKSLPCHIRGALRSEDTEVMIDCLGRMGYQLDVDWADDGHIILCSHERHVNHSSRDVELFVGNSGTTMRFLTALAARGSTVAGERPERYRLDGVRRMRERPIEDLLAALRQLGVNACSVNGDGCPPVIIKSGGLRGGTVRIRGDISSQFLSGLLMIAPEAETDITIEVEGSLVSRPYVDMTVAMMRQMGRYAIDRPNPNVFEVQRQHGSWTGDYSIEPDASSASYWFAAAAILQGEITVRGLDADSVQGDVMFVDHLANMGATVTKRRSGPSRTAPSDASSEKAITVSGGPLRGVNIDMNDTSDMVMTLAAVASFAEGPTTIRNVAHIRHKETDRLTALATELRRVGAAVEERADGLTITPRPLHGAEIETYNDHRIAMSMALIGLKVPGIIIRNPGCVAKTYPGFFDDLEMLRNESLPAG